MKHHAKSVKGVGQTEHCTKHTLLLFKLYVSSLRLVLRPFSDSLHPRSFRKVEFPSGSRTHKGARKITKASFLSAISNQSSIFNFFESIQHPGGGGRG